MNTRRFVRFAGLLAFQCSALFLASPAQTATFTRDPSETGTLADQFPPALATAYALARPMGV